MLQGQLHIHFGTNLPVTQLWSLHGGRDYGLLGCATMSFGEWVSSYVATTCQPNLHSVTFKQTLSAINNLCCLNNEVWFFCTTVLKHIRGRKKKVFFEFCCCFSTIHVTLKLMYDTVRFCACMINFDILVIYLKYYNICSNLKTMQWQEKCAFRRKNRPCCGHQNTLLYKNNEELIHILAYIFSDLIAWST
jgi:hypothetical protein